MARRELRTDLLISRSGSRVWIILALLLIGGVVALGYAAYVGWHDLAGVWTGPLRMKSDEELVRKFAAFKNADDLRANDLLGPPPLVPEHAISPEEAGRLDAEFILRRPFQVIGVSRAWQRGDPTRFKLVVKGGIASEPLLVEGAAKPTQRVLYNPDIIVEVRDDKLYGVRAQLHED